MEIQSAKTLALQLMTQHNLIQEGWKFEFDNAKVRFGVCRYTRKIIGLSQYLTKLNEESQVKDTILHEIAHALVGHAHGHDYVWQRKAREIGCNGLRCYSSETTQMMPPKFIAICSSCKGVHGRYKRPRISSLQSCGKCSSRYNPNFILKWEPNYKKIVATL